MVWMGIRLKQGNLEQGNLEQGSLGEEKKGGPTQHRWRLQLFGQALTPSVTQHPAIGSFSHSFPPLMNGDETARLFRKTIEQLKHPKNLQRLQNDPSFQQELLDSLLKQLKENPDIPDLLTEATAYATRLHRHQKRRGTSIPYNIHPLGTAAILAEYTQNAKLTAAGLLHDAIEDYPDLDPETEGTGGRMGDLQRLFGHDVATLVAMNSDNAVNQAQPGQSAKWWITNGYNEWVRSQERSSEEKHQLWLEKKQRFHKKLAAAPWPVLMLKAADKLDNLQNGFFEEFPQSDDPDFPEKSRTHWNKLRSGKMGYCWSVLVPVRMMTERNHHSDQPLFQELERTVQAMLRRAEVEEEVALKWKPAF